MGKSRGRGEGEGNEGSLPSSNFGASFCGHPRALGPGAFLRTKVTTIKDPLGAFVQALLPLRKNPVAHYRRSCQRHSRGAGRSGSLQQMLRHD